MSTVNGKTPEKSSSEYPEKYRDRLLSAALMLTRGEITEIDFLVDYCDVIIEQIEDESRAANLLIDAEGLQAAHEAIERLTAIIKSRTGLRTNQSRT